MKKRNQEPEKNSLAGCLILVIIIMVLLLLATACSTQKHIVSTKATVDSTAINEKDSIIRVLTQDNQRLTSEIHELQYAGVTFDTSGQHPVYIIEGEAACNVDSILALLHDANNKVKIYADGTIEANGRLKSAYYSKDKANRFIIELQRINDSLRAVKQKEEIRYITNTVTVDRQVKRSLLNFWWLFMIGFISATALWNGKTIISYLRR